MEKNVWKFKWELIDEQIQSTTKHVKNAEIC